MTCGSLDNGRDNLGDNQPPDELNHAPKVGLHFGYPIAMGERSRILSMADKHACREFTASAKPRSGPMSPPLGMRFYTGTMFPFEIPAPNLYCGAWFVESERENRLSDHARVTR